MESHWENNYFTTKKDIPISSPEGVFQLIRRTYFPYKSSLAKLPSTKTLLFLTSSRVKPNPTNQTNSSCSLVQLFAYFVFTSVCFVWIIIWGDRTLGWNTFQSEVLLHLCKINVYRIYNLTNKLCAFVICKQTKESGKSSERLLDPESFVFYWTQVLRHWHHRHVLLNFWRMRIRSSTFWKEWWREKSNNCNDDRTGDLFCTNKCIFFYSWFSRIIIISRFVGVQHPHRQSSLWYCFN